MAFKSFLDARHQDAGSVIETDLCIVGSGAAGITIAREFVGSSVRVCLLEAGGISIDAEVDQRSVIDNVGHDYDKDNTRLRLFGGSTNHWGGNCLPLQPIDFEKLDWINYSGWPYAYEDFEPYYRRASRLRPKRPQSPPDGLVSPICASIRKRRLRCASWRRWRVGLRSRTR